MSEKGKITRGRLGSLSLKKEGERQCFLFSKHLIICTRGSGGKLHLTKVGGGGAGTGLTAGPAPAAGWVGCWERTRARPTCGRDGGVLREGDGRWEGDCQNPQGAHRWVPGWAGELGA